jgi:peptide/nickel transport system substrate-binding protein
VVYAKNEAYVPRPEPASGLAGGKVAKVDRIERIEMADQLSAVNALIKHEIDYLETVPFDLLPMVEGLPGVVVERLDTLGYQPVYRFNHLHPPFNNKLVRQAAMYAIGQEAALQTQIGNPKYYRPCAAVFGCGIPSDIEKAKSLLKASGYNGERVVVLQATDIPLIASMPIVIAQHLREAGFNVDLQAMDFMTVLSRRSNRASVADGGWSLFVTTWHNTEVEDPVRSFTVTANGNDAWAGWPTVPAIVEGTNQFLLAPDEEHRKEIANRLQELVIDEGVVGPLGSVTKPVGYSTAISGVLHAPVQVFWNISK